jgi:tRNA threonylcarbamoyl adenosine modification protein (Sua5/YciO/YrdC/YwlC family)
MATLYEIHPDTPQVRRIEQIREALRDGAVMLYPTDTVYAIGCDLNVKTAVERVRQIKQLSNDKPLTFLCPSLSNIAAYAVVSDPAYKLLKRLIPGPYTFLLPATKLVPRLVMSPKRRTTGIRVPDHTVCHTLLETLGNPIISTSALSVAFPNAESYDVVRRSPAELFDRLDSLVDVIVDDGSPLTAQVSTILDLTTLEPKIVRQGLGWEAAVEWGAETAGANR